MGNGNQKPQQSSQNPNQDEGEGEGEGEEEETFTCEICIEPVTLPNNKLKNSNRCVHPFCTDCIIKYIKVKLEDNVSDIKCPAMACNHSLEPLSCRPILAHQLFDKWCEALCESAVLKLDRVYCPNKHCSALILNECGDGDLKRCVCPDCRKPFCFRCKVPWHAGYRCEESGETTRDQNDVAFGVLSERNQWRRCPKCRHCVELADGCSIVRCRCGIEFCYRCGKEASHYHRCTDHICSLLIWLFIYLLILIISQIGPRI